MINHHGPQRAYHAVNLLAMLILSFTGFYIYQPFASGLMGTMRYVHFITAFILVLNLLLRIYYAFLGRWRDYGEFSPKFKNVPGQIKYYLFLSNREIHEGKYNSLQRIAYLLLIPLFILQAITGFAIGWPQGMFSSLSNQYGLAELRAIHYLLTWMFVSFVIIHVYLVFTEAPRAFREMFLGNQESAPTNLQRKYAAK